MIKYSLVLHHSDYEGFMDSLQSLGVVDITISGWEATDSERELIQSIEKQKLAMDQLGERLKNKSRVKAEPFASAQEAFANYVESSSEISKLNLLIAKTAKERDELKVWGDFDIAAMNGLKKDGVDLHFYSTFTKEFDLNIDMWREQYVIQEISESNGTTHFVVVTTPDSASISIDALEVKTPESNYLQKEAQLEDIRSQLSVFNGIMERCAENYDSLRNYGIELSDKLHLSKVKTTSNSAAEGSLVLLEGWATEDTQQNVDTFIESSPVVSIKDIPSAEDEPPVLLKNNKFARLFEVIGRLYALPRYGTIDLTPYFAPFYMLFFGFCLGDLGYGALFVLGALIAYKKVKPDMRPILQLVIYCGLSAMFFGIITGNLFGIQLAEQSSLEAYKNYFLTADGLFPLAIGLGIFQILYAMVLKVCLITKIQGFKYAFATIGWMIVIISGLTAYLLTDIGITVYTMSSTPFYIVTGIGLFMMLFLNSPGKNPFVNFGSGLWNTYNDVTGLLGDVLSYIRLFALGLSSGILALVFNKLAVGMSPDIIIVKQIVMILILVAGQGINLFMATLSSFVHPLRLTFVEFYKNAGFEAGGREFNPLKRGANN